MKEPSAVNRRDFFFGVTVAGAGLVGTGAAAAPSALPAGGWERGVVDVLAVLPDVTPGVQSSVEGLTVGLDGNIYVPSFGYNTQGALTGNAVLFVISPKGDIVRQVTIVNSSPHTLGLEFNPVTERLCGSSTSGPAMSFRSIQRPACPAYWRARSPVPASMR